MSSLPLIYGWDSWTRTSGVQESKSCALTVLAISHYIRLYFITNRAYCQEEITEKAEISRLDVSGIIQPKYEITAPREDCAFSDAIFYLYPWIPNRCP